MLDKNITIALTSCGRYNSLKKTIESLSLSLDLDKYRKVMTEDSGDTSHILKIKKEVKAGFLKGWEVIFTGIEKKNNLYQSHYKALEVLYSKVQTKYVFHCEDDQIFQMTTYDYLQLSYKILENNSSVSIVLLRDIIGDFGLKKIGIKKSRYYEILSEEEVRYFGIDFIVCSKNNSFSLQPGMRNTKLMKEVMFGYESYVNEEKVGLRLNSKGYKSIVMKNGIYNHISPIFNSTKNVKNLGLINYLKSTITGTIKYRGGLILKYLKLK